MSCKYSNVSILMCINDRYEFKNYLSLNLKYFDNVCDRSIMILRICHRFKIFERICIMIFQLLKNVLNFFIYFAMF
jgi:hypothetical protein